MGDVADLNAPAGASAIDRVVDGAVDRLAALGDDRRIYVVPDARLMFVALNKNACTSLKWLVASIAGEDMTRFKAGVRAYTTDQEAVHNRNLWTRALTMDQVPADIRAQIAPQNGWFIFAVVRDPRSRIFSAWTNKLLLDNAGYTHHRKAPWYPRHVFEPEKIRAEFASFVDILAADPEHRLLRVDNHFMSQTALLALDHIDYSKIYNMNEIGQLRKDVEAHLISVGYAADLVLPATNRAPLSANASVFANGVREKIEQIYADDFAMFGDRWDFAKIASAPEWTKAELAEAELRATLGHRISELRDHVVRLRRRLDAERARADELAQRVSALEQQRANGTVRARTRRTMGKVRRRLGRLRRGRSGAPPV